jgi:hypothetical protein
LLKPLPSGALAVAPQNAKLISLAEDYEIKYWTDALGVTRERLAAGIKALGHSVAKVGEYLKSS